MLHSVEFILWRISFLNYIIYFVKDTSENQTTGHAGLGLQIEL